MGNNDNSNGSDFSIHVAAFWDRQRVVKIIIIIIIIIILLLLLLLL